MKNLKQNLFITYSNQKARDLKQSSLAKPLDRVITLDAFILELFEKSSFQVVIDEQIGSSIIYKCIQDVKCEYFSYLKSDAVSLGTIYNFIVKCHRNEVAFETLHVADKLEALKSIDRAYQLYKQKHNLVDIADVEKSVLDSFSLENLKEYEALHVDEFQVGGISFVKSKIQKEILQKLSTCKKISQPKQDKKPKLIKPSNEVFNNTDEVKTALKIARKLLEEGQKSQDILIVATDIKEYAPLFKLFLSEYELKGFSSLGTPLSHFVDDSSLKVKTALQNYKMQVNSLEELYKKIGLKLDKSEKQQLKSTITLQDEKIGLEMTEPNQIVGLNRSYKHIIFLGTDINHFPPKATDNFLYSYEDDLNYFCANNYFTSSQTQYSELKRLCENLYIITANYSGKRELVPSIIIDREFDEVIDIGEVKSKNDLVLQNISTEKTEWLKSSENRVEGIKATYLSASQINSYNSCPLAYFLQKKLKLKAPNQEEEGFDVMEKGSLMHLCYELFGRAIKSQKNTSTCKEDLYELMFEKSQEAYACEETIKDRGEENIHHKVFLSNLQAGLKDEREAGLLKKFVDYYAKKAKEFDYFKNSEFEKEFALNSELKPYKLKDKNDKNYFIKGFIDRFDNLESHINIVDYKSKKVERKDKGKQEDVETLKDIQLALYILYAKQEYQKDKFNAHLLSFKGNTSGIEFASLDDIDEEEVKQMIYKTKKSIEEGDFHFNNEDKQQCDWCDMKFVCHQGVVG
jgi:hypothetical protein